MPCRMRLLLLQLHKQQFLELVRQGDRMAAVQYASEHLSTLATVPAHVHEIQQVGALFCRTSCPTYTMTTHPGRVIMALTFPGKPGQ